jgi:hypothetical protein
MKAIYKKTLSILILMGGIFTANSQNLESLPQAQRDSLLISLAKEAVLRYGPGYYREYKEPIIERGQIQPKGTMNPTGENVGRIYYIITFLYDTIKERLGDNFAAIVGFWGDTGKPSYIRLGNNNGYTRSISESEWDSDAEVEQTPYHEMIFPIYDWDDPENKEPKNIDELRRKGYVEKDGGWIQTEKEVPPNTDILKRKGYEERDGRWVKTKKEVPARIK